MANKHPGIGHLEFYKSKGISPVHQDISDLERHLQRRESLYRMLGLPALAFRKRRVLEVAPGSGHNSLYVASCRPEEYHLVEPNPTAVREIGELYQSIDLNLATPTIHAQRLEEFAPQRPVEIAICEGWLGGSTYELGLLRKLADCVEPQGILVISWLSPIGTLSSFLRRLLAWRLLNGETDFDTQTVILADAFRSHLETLGAMSRSVEHWVQDNLINPALLWQILTPSQIIDHLGQDFTVYGSVPQLASDWRWYKSIFGNERQYNKRFLDQYFSLAHNLLDTRVPPTAPRDPQANKVLEEDCARLVALTAAYEKASLDQIREHIVPLIDAIAQQAKAFAPQAELALTETARLLETDGLTAQQVADARHLRPLFGREMCYMALIRG